jgi:heavy metal translocating P-type ATPase
MHFCCSGCAVTHTILGASAEEGESALFLARLGFAGFLSMNIVAVSWMVYDNGFATFGLTADVLPAFEALLFVLSIPVMLLVGIPFARAALKELRTFSLSTDSLIAVGSFSAFFFSTYQLATGGRGIYYDTATMTLVLVTLGRYIEATAKGRAHHSIRELLELQPATARILRDAGEETVAAASVHIGDTIRVLAGERIPLDGVVRNGKASIDESALTGESNPRTRGRGDTALAATLALDGSIDIEVRAETNESAHAQAIRLLEEARGSRSSLQLVVDRISAVFLPSVILLSIGSTVVWSFFIPVEQAFINGLTVLVVSCPCALGIGTPLALTYALHRAAKEGVLIRAHAIIERLSSVRHLLFDKTGTITTGRPSVRSWHSDDELSDVQRFLSSLESHSVHPIGKGIVRSSAIPSGDLLPVRNVNTLPGQGIEGEVLIREKWTRVRIIHAHDPQERENFSRFVSGDRAPRGDESEILAYIDGKPYALIRIADTIREDAGATISSLHRSGYKTALLSGDDARAVTFVAEATRIPHAYGELLPAQKLDHIRSFGVSAPTAMVGDGINDAPSLAAAHVGIAMAGGTDIAKENADVVIVGDRLSRIPWLIAHARRTVGVIRWNLFWAFGYNIVAIVLALAGLLQPVLAAGAMVLSSISIIVHSSRAANSPSKSPF